MEDAVFNKLLLVLMVMGIIVLVIYQYYAHQSEMNTLKSTAQICPVCPVCPACTIHAEQPVQTIAPVSVPETGHHLSPHRNIFVDVKQSEAIVPPPVDAVREYDYRALSDPLVPPYKRDDYQIPLPAIPTRGYPSSFKKIGLLVDSETSNTDPYKFMLLMGRQKYPGSNFYDYYVTENKPDSALKFDLPNLHKELNTDDTLPLTDLNKTYTVKIDRNLGFDYNPFVY